MQESTASHPHIYIIHYKYMQIFHFLIIITVNLIRKLFYKNRTKGNNFPWFGFTSLLVVLLYW